MARKVDDGLTMLDAIRQSIKEKYISADQLKMVAKNTSGKRGEIECQICLHREENILLCCFDQEGYNHMLFPYFNEVSGLVSMCDYILFVEYDKCMFVFLIELKDSIHGADKQTGIAKTFAEFLVNRILAVKGNAIPLKSVEYRRVGVKTSHSKMTTKGYESLAYNENGYAVLPDYRKFFVKQMKEL